MRFMIMVRSAPAVPDPQLTAAMAAYQEELARAGVLLDGAGRTVIEVRSRGEALEWARRFPNPMGLEANVEIRQLKELEHEP